MRVKGLYKFFVETEAVEYYFREGLLNFIFLHPLQQDYYIFYCIVISSLAHCNYPNFLESQENSQINVLFTEGHHFGYSLGHYLGVLV